MILLDGFELRLRGGAVNPSRSVQRVLAFLALQERAVPREHVAGTLWPNIPEGRASASLRTTLWRLQRICGGLVRTSREDLQIGDGVAVDVHEMRRACRLLLDTARPAAASETLTRTSTLLPGWYEDWAVSERERLRQMRLHALEALCDRLIGAGDFAGAVDAGLAAVESDPLRETAHHALIRAYLSEGNRGEAIRQYEAYRRTLQDELGLEPATGVRELVRPLGVDRPRDGDVTSV